MATMLVNFAFWTLPTIIFCLISLTLLLWCFTRGRAGHGLGNEKSYGDFRGRKCCGSSKCLCWTNRGSPNLKAISGQNDQVRNSLFNGWRNGHDSGRVLAAIIGVLGIGDPVQELFYAKHLLAASIMSAPATIVFSKILLPEKKLMSIRQ
jgi:hypothetical protein